MECDTQKRNQALFEMAEAISTKARRYNAQKFTQFRISVFCPCCGQQELYASITRRCLLWMDCLLDAQVDCMICDESFEVDLSVTEPEPDVAVDLDAGRKWASSLYAQKHDLN